MRRLIVAASATVLAIFPGLGMAAGLPSESPLATSKPVHTTNPDWARIPAGAGPVFPRQAWLRHVTGVVVIRCKINTEGRTQDCAIAQETPAGYGFGAAAVKFSHSFLFHPATRDGKPVESSITIPIKFALPGIPAPPVSPALSRPTAAGVPEAGTAGATSAVSPSSP